MRKTSFLGLLILILLTPLGLVLQAQETVNWMTWEEAMTQSKNESRKIFVDIYTDWCSWCKQMDETTFTDANIVRYLNANYYPVKLNAQQQEDILFNKETFRYVENGVNSYHEFAYKIMNGEMKYPTVVFIDEKQQVIQSIPGFRNPFELELFMIYFGENKHQTQPWFRFKKDQELFRQNSLQMPVTNGRN